ncbi:MAG: carboxypeptidase regulatory-like domain-containing protein [Deltaproteobacteria bacterium]|nr:carboxypeptidase regulatory-like domain-containing protein [Deltaproteobacteria bacterium]
MRTLEPSAVVVLALLGGCQCGDQLGEVPGRVDGQVCDPTSGRPLASVPVRLDVDGAVVGTDGEGRYTFASVAAGEDVVVVGTGSAARRFPVVIESSLSAVVVDVACRPLPAGFGVIEGELCGLDGDPLGDALVSVTIDDETVSQSRTDVDGAFRLASVPVGDRILEVRSAGGARDIAVLVLAGQTTVIPAALTCAGDEVPVENPAPPPTEETPPTEPTEEIPPTPAEEPEPTPPSVPPAAPPAPSCSPRAEVCENGSDEDCDGVDNACDPITLDLFVDGDCVTARCPAAAPHPVGCDIRLQGGDERGCVANAPGSSVVYFQEGDACGAGRVSGTLFCSSFLPPEPLNDDNCPINKERQFHVTDRDGCPETD